jgi:hypothetical protein
MTADQRLKRVKIAGLRRRDKEPITGPNYHRIATVPRKHGYRARGTHRLAMCDPPHASDSSREVETETVLAMRKATYSE